MENKKKFRWILSFLLLAGIIVLGIYLKSVGDYQRAVSKITFSHIPLSEVSDGIYTGECDVKFIEAKVAVTVENGKIMDIDILEHKNGRGTSAEAVIDAMLDEQTIDVDVVSGATNSSIVLKKAVENALNQGLS